MSPPVFISYARHTSRELARRLEEALGPAEAFLDESDLEAGTVFTRGLVEALLGSRVVVVFADGAYFRRWYCLRELRAALAPYLALGTEATGAEKEAELGPLVIVRPPGERAPEELRRLPALLRDTQWRRGDDLPGLVELVRTRVAAAPLTLGERLERRRGGARAELRKRLLEELVLPPPRSLAGFRPLHPIQWPASLNEGFKGRADELWQVDFHLSTLRRDEASGAGSTVALVAGGGYGKTRLALEYVYRLGPVHYPGGIFWVDAAVEKEDEREEQLHGILRALRPEVPELVAFRKQGRDAAAELAEALHETARSGVLYVVDNIPEAPPGAAPRPLDTWCPAVGKVALLVTSRARQGAEGIHSLEVGTLSREAAVQLLTHEVKGAAWEDAAWARIAEWVGHLPLALAVLNRALQYGGVTREELLELARHQGPVRALDRQMEALRGQLPAESLRGVTEALLMSYERLPEAARKTARYLAQLAPAPVPLALLKELGPEAASPEVRVALVTRNFVTEARGVEPEQVPLFGSMHRVLADLARGQSPDARRERGEVCAALLRVMTAEASRDPWRWGLMSACLPHAEKLFEELGREKTATREEAAQRVELGLRIGKLSRTRGLPGRAQEVAELTLERAREVLGEEHPDTLEARSNLAQSLWSQGRYVEARALHERVWQGRRRVLGEEHRYTLEAMADLASTLSDMGGYEEARRLQTRELELSQRVLGEEHPDTLTAMNNLSVTRSCQGDYPGARQLQTRLLEMSRRVLGEAHPNTLLYMANLASTHFAQGDLRGARELHARQWEVSRRVLGEEHPDTLRAMVNLAATRFAQGDAAGALGLRTRVLEVSRRVLGEEHPDTLRAMSHLASTRSFEGDTEGALGLQTRVLEVSRRVLGEEHPDTLTAMHNLALTHHARGEHASARQLQTRVLEARRRVLGEEHPDTLMAMNNLASTRTALGEHPGTHELQKRALEVSRRVLGEEHPGTLLCMSTLANTLSAQGDLEGARRYETQVVEVSRRVLGEAHFDTLTAMHNLALTLIALGDPAGARPLLTRVVEVRRQVLGEGHPHTRQAQRNLADTEAALRKAPKEQPLGKRLWSALRRALH